MVGEELGDRVDWIACIAERKIQEAMDEGLFDNLPGSGKPLNLDSDMDPVSRLLKHNNVLPPWVYFEREIEAARERALRVLERWERNAAALLGTPDYPAGLLRARSEYAALMNETNTLILKYNCANPFTYRIPIPFAVNKRLADFDAKFPPAAASS